MMSGWVLAIPFWEVEIELFEDDHKKGVEPPRTEYWTLYVGRVTGSQGKTKGKKEDYSLSSFF